MIELIADESALAPEQCCRLGQVCMNWRQGLLQARPDPCSAVRKGA